MGEDADGAQAEVRRLVDRGGDARAVGGGHVGHAVAADVGVQRLLQPDELAVLVERQRSFDHHVARLIVGHERLGAVGQPLHRLAELARRPHGKHVFGVEMRARPEPAAHVAGDNVEFLRVAAEHDRRVALEPVNALVADVELEAVALVFRDAAARLHLRVGDAVEPELLLDHGGGVLECFLRRGEVAVGRVEGDVIGRLVPHGGCAGLDRIHAVGDGGQHLVIDLDQLAGVLRVGEGVGDHEGDDLADMVHLAGDDRDVGRGEGLAAVRLGKGGDAMVFRLHRNGAVRDAFQPVGGVFRAGEDVHHARRFLRGGEVEPAHACVRVDRPHGVAVKLTREADVVGIGAVTGEEPLVLPADEMCADPGIHVRRGPSAG